MGSEELDELEREIATRYKLHIKFREVFRLKLERHIPEMEEIAIPYRSNREKLMWLLAKHPVLRAFIKEESKRVGKTLKISVLLAPLILASPRRRDIVAFKESIEKNRELRRLYGLNDLAFYAKKSMGLGGKPTELALELLERWHAFYRHYLAERRGWAEEG